MRGIAAGLILLALAGCDRFGGGSRSNAVTSTPDRDLDQQMLDERVDHIENQMLEVRMQSQSSIILQPQDHDFAPIESGLGTLTVSIQNVSAYADGSRVRLQIGNPTSANILRFNFQVRYGSGRYPNGDDRQQNIQFSETLSRGSWHNLNLDLAGVPPSRLGHMEITNFEAARIGLDTR